MEIEQFIQIALLFISVYLAFFKSYLSEKGKSAALKEDLHDLTKEVESVKNEFTKEQEILKTDLQRLLNNEISYRNEERNALINFYAIINEWRFSILEIRFGDYDKTNINTLKELRQSISTYFSKAGIAKSKIELLVEDYKLIDAANQLYIQSLSFQHWTNSKLFELQLHNERIKTLSEQFLVIIKDIEKNKKTALSMSKEEDELRLKSRKLFDEYMDNRNEENNKITPISIQFEKLVKDYLKK